MLTKCVNCGFYVRQDDEFCLNCGFTSPSKPEFEKFSVKRFALISSVLFVFFTIFVFLIAGQDRIDIIYGLCFGLLLCVTFGIIITQAIEIFVITKNLKSRQTFQPSSLKTKNVIIEKRISELNQRSRNIDKVLDKIKETDSQNLQEVRRKLLSAREIVISQFARYELQKKKIELVRLQNGVSPYLYSLHRLNESESEKGLLAIENTQNEVNKIRQNLTNYVAIEFPKKTLPEKQNFLAQLAETENSCEKLREALLSRQAARALQDISPLEENLKLPNAKEIVHAAETFNIQTTLTDFSESFDELEHEYKRLRAEEETSQKLLES